MKVIFAGATDVGKVREHNEDSLLIMPDRNLVVVCDGMGGHAAGEVASQIGIETISKIYNDYDLNQFQDPLFRYPEAITSEGKLLVGSIALANQRIVERGRQTPGQTGMGTTVIACHFNNGVVSICHVGDSRAYLIRGENIKRVTIDHSWVSEVMEKHNLSEEESENLVNKNVITRALGTKPQIRIDISQVRVVAGDLFIICSDGLTGMVNDSTILKLASANSDNLEKLVRDLIDAANEAGGVDNVSLCVAKVIEQEEIDDFDEVRRVTVEWGEEPEISKVRELAQSLFSQEPGEAAPVDEPAPDTINYKIVEPKKKRLGRTFLWVLLAIVAITAVTIWYLESV